MVRYARRQFKRLLRRPVGATSLPEARPDGPATELRKQVEQYYWFHSIDLGSGVVTPGVKKADLLRADGEASFRPLNLMGNTGSQRPLNLSAGAGRSRSRDRGARHRRPRFAVDRVGQFDVVLFLGVFYHLVDPISALQNLAGVTREVAVVETHLDLRELGRPGMIFLSWGRNSKAIQRTGGDPIASVWKHCSSSRDSAASSTSTIPW
jgi:hypothetical protein